MSERKANHEPPRILPRGTRMIQNADETWRPAEADEERENAKFELLYDIDLNCVSHPERFVKMLPRG